MIYIACEHPAFYVSAATDLVSFFLVLQAVKKLGLWGMFTRGLPLRIFMIGTLTGAQWVIYDAVKVLAGL